MKFVKNVFYSFGANILILIIGLAISILIARILGPEGQGIYAIIITFTLIIITFSNLGLSRSIIYHIGRNIYPFKNLIGNISFLGILISVISTIVGFFIVYFFGNILFPNIPKEILFIGLLFIPFQILFQQVFSGIILGIQKIKEYNITLIIQSIIFITLMTILFLSLYKGIIGVIISNLVSLILINILLFFILKIKLEIPFSIKVDKNILKSLSSFGYKSNIGPSVSFIHLRADTFLINFFLNPQSVGFYAISVGFAELLWTLSQNVSLVLYPKIASMKDDKQKKVFTPILSRNIFLITLCSALIILISSKWLIVLLYSERYIQSVEPLQILLIGIVAISAERILTNDLIARGKPMINNFSSTITLIINLILNILLIPILGINGAAWASSISYTVNLVLTLYFYCRISENSAKEVLLIKKLDYNLYLNIWKSIKNNLNPSKIVYNLLN